jgi:quaternary ammonium compound-resistance protein SugE
MAWLYLFLAGLFEVAWAIGLKYTEGFSRLFPSLFTIAAMALSLALLGLALKRWVRPMPSGPASALSAPQRSESTFSTNRRRYCALPASV